MSDSTNFYNQTFNSRAVVFEVYLGKAGNITEAPPVADEARRCWRKTRSIAPAPRAIGDYVLRGLNGLRSKTHEPVLFERSEFTGECAELPTESRELCTAAWRCRGYRGAAHRKVSTHRFCAAKLLALKSIGFLMTGKKKARRNAPAFQALFSQHGAKRLTFKRCLLAFLWAQFAFLLQAFSFSNKKKMPKRG